MILGIAGLILYLMNDKYSTCSDTDENWLRNTYSVNLVSSFLVFLVYFVLYILRPDTNTHMKFINGSTNYITFVMIFNQIYTSVWTFYSYDKNKYCYDFNLAENYAVKSLFTTQFTMNLVLINVLCFIIVICICAYIFLSWCENREKPSRRARVVRDWSRRQLGISSTRGDGQLTNVPEEATELVNK